MANSDRLIEVFNHAQTLAAGPDRDAFLAGACEGDPELKEQVHSLLHAQERAGVFMHARPALSPEIEAELARLKPEAVGERIGPYRLMEQIGEGGFGTVWVADQERPIRRRVALKIIKVGMDTKDVIARFEQERQALAMMDHPNIARVLDAGATEWGRPYFVMELVRGIKITDYCDQANLSTADRLALFTQVCHAVQHAHHHGIIHRDLKPSNILVTLHDGVPVPKVIDFGIAKATQQQRLTDLTIYTQFQQMIGTPLYMSPEQAEMSGLEMDTRADIYSLGVLLYELLTGRTPFDPEELMKVGYDEIRRVIREQEPPTPSMSLRTMADEARATVAQHRQSDPTKLTNQLRGDLDWIVMKALEKDRTRRYSTAIAFADDIQRHLTDKPIVARPPSAGYVIKKHILRNRNAYATVVIALVATLTALVIGMRMSGGSSPENNSIAQAEAAAPTPRPLRLVKGSVSGEDTGLPLADALVLISSPAQDMRFVYPGEPDIYEGRTDEAGRFAIQVPQADKFSVDALAPGFETVAGTNMGGSKFAMDDLSFGDQPPDLEIKLTPALYVAGVIVDEQGRPLSAVEVESTLHFSDGAYGYIETAETGDDGRFEIFNYPLDPGSKTGRLRFEHQGTLRTEIANVYALDANARKSLRIIMRPGKDISGTVTTVAGRPAAKTLIEAVPADSTQLYKQTTTDADGNFVLEGLPDGEIQVRVHSLELEQKASATAHLAAADLKLNLRLQPVVMENPLVLFNLLGMRLADITPELKTAYDLPKDVKGVLLVEPGENIERLDIGTPRGGEYFWIVGEKEISTVREMVEEILRINQRDPADWIQEGCKGSIRVVYSNRHHSNTQYLKLTDADTAELTKLAAALRNVPGN